MKVTHSWFIAGFLFIITILILAVDPFAMHAYHAPKQYLLPFLVSALAVSAFIPGYTSGARLNTPDLLELLLTFRLIWVAFTNPEYVLNLNNSGFLILAALTLLVMMVRRVLSSGKAKLRVTGIRWFWVVVFCAGVLQIPVSIYQLYAGMESGPLQNIKTPMVGTIGSPNGLGLFLVISIIAGGRLLCYSFNRPLKSLLVSATITLFAILIMTASRGPILLLLGFLTAAATVLYLRRNTFETNPGFQRAFFSALGAIVIVAIAAITLVNLDRDSAEGRVMVWEITMGMIVDKPFQGVGFQQYGHVYPEYQAEYLSRPDRKHRISKASYLHQVHNEYLHAIAETGIAGGLIFLSIWITVIYYYIRWIKHVHAYTSFHDRILLFSVLMIILLHSLIDTPMHALPLNGILFGIMGFLPLSDKQYPIRAGKVLFLIMAILIFIMLLLSGWKIAQQYPGYRYWHEAISLNQKCHHEKRIAKFEQAIDFLPQNGPLLYALGAAYSNIGQKEQAMTILRRSREHLTHHQLYLAMGSIHIRQREYGKALLKAEKAAELAPDHLKPRLLQAEAHYYLGNRDESKALLNSIIRLETSIYSEEVKRVREMAQHYNRQWFQNID